MEDLNTRLMIGKIVHFNMKDQIKIIIIKYWNFFYDKVVWSPVLEY